MELSVNMKKYLFFLVLIIMVSGCSSADIKGAFEPEVLFSKANDMIGEGDYAGAREVLEDIRARDATRKYATLATVRIADTYYEDKEYEEAAAEYESFLSVHPYHKYSSYAQYKLAMSYFSRIKTVDVSYSWAKKALDEFEKLRRNYPRNPYMDITENRIMSCRKVLAEYELYVGKFYLKKGSYDSAALRFDGLIHDYPDSGREPDALFYLARAYEGAGEKEKAVKVLNHLIEKFPNMEISVEARELAASMNGQK